MARPRKEKSNIAVSPVNGQPVPRGRQFTSETASEAARKGHEKRKAQKSITAAFLRYMEEEVAKDADGTPLTGAQAIAKSIIRGASRGNAEMVKIALALTGETPVARAELFNITPEDDALTASIRALGEKMEAERVKATGKAGDIPAE